MVNNSGDPMAAPFTFNITGAVAASGLSRTRIYDLLRSGELEAVRCGGRTLVRGSSLRAYLDGLPDAGLAQAAYSRRALPCRAAAAYRRRDRAPLPR